VNVVGLAVITGKDYEKNHQGSYINKVQKSGLKTA
jgi:hypothetical protein